MLSELLAAATLVLTDTLVVSTSLSLGAVAEIVKVKSGTVE